MDPALCNLREMLAAIDCDLFDPYIDEHNHGDTVFWGQTLSANAECNIPRYIRPSQATALGEPSRSRELSGAICQTRLADRTAGRGV